MSGEIPTLGGMTPSQFADVCEKSARLQAKEAIAASDFSRLGRPLTEMEQMMLDLGVMTAVKATFDELARRGLIVEQP